MINLIFLYSVLIYMHAEYQMTFSEIKTPDDKSFKVAVISKEETDALQRKYSSGLLTDSLLPISGARAFKINGEMILFRQFEKGRGFIFPTISDYSFGIRGESYFETNIQTDKDGSKIYVAFNLRPDFVNKISEQAVNVISDYETFEGREFYLLKNQSTLIKRKRTSALSDGYWFPSMKDFDFFYYILSGKAKPSSTSNNI